VFKDLSDENSDVAPKEHSIQTTKVTVHLVIKERPVIPEIWIWCVAKHKKDKDKKPLVFIFIQESIEENQNDLCNNKEGFSSWVNFGGNVMTVVAWFEICKCYNNRNSDEKHWNNNCKGSMDNMHTVPAFNVRLNTES